MPHPTAGSVKMAPRSCPNTPTHSSRSPKFPPHKHSGSPPFSWQPPLLCITFAGGRAGMEPARKGAVKEGAPLRQPMLGATLPSARPAAFLSTHTPTCTHPHAHTHMHTHTHTHMHTHTPTCTHTRTHTCTRTHPHAHTHTHTPTCTHPHAHAHTHMHTHTHTPTCTHPHAHTHMHTHTPTCTHTHTHTHTHTPTCTHPHAHAHTHMHTHTHTHTPTCTHARTRTHPHAHTHAHAHTHMHTPTCTRTHPHAHAHTHMHTHTHTHAHAHTHMHTPTCTRTHTHAHTRTHTCTRTHPHAHTHTHAHAHAHTCTHMHTPTCTRTHPHAHTHTHAHAHAHTCTHMHTPTHAHTHTPTCTHAHMHTCTCTHAHAHMHTHMHTHTHAHTHTHTRTCTHTHTHTRWDGTMGLAGGVGVGCSCTVNWSPSQIKGWMELVPGGLSPSTASVSAPRPVTRNPAAGSLLLYEAGPGRCCGDLRGVRGHRSPTRAGPGTGRNLQERHGAPRRGPARELSSHGESLRVPAPDRHLARLVQVGCPVVMLLQDASVLTETGGIKPRPHFAKQPLQWEEDIQLYSWFLDRKEELRASYTSYVQQHPELKAQMADFLLTLLLQRPHDSVSFATQFFTSLACQQPPGSPFASAEAARPLPSPPPHHSPANRE
ncbi:ciliogenesis-associated TTC17-interacting protein isoform X4 [Pogoniulus pusillus]|uniref:ciliogenesis-associated TTC17-interacting protein isoform X4 n=1 Tax=Pogoniulus pusillus TaxID=488313 RepID=UPI0030B9A007